MACPFKALEFLRIIWFLKCDLNEIARSLPTFWLVLGLNINDMSLKKFQVEKKRIEIENQLITEMCVKKRYFFVVSGRRRLLFKLIKLALRIFKFWVACLIFFKEFRFHTVIIQILSQKWNCIEIF